MANARGSVQVHSLQVELAQSKTSNTEKACVK